MCQAPCIYARLFSHLLLTIPPRIIIPITDGESEDKATCPRTIEPRFTCALYCQAFQKESALGKKKKKKKSFVTGTLTNHQRKIYLNLYLNHQPLKVPE